ncbi:MAG: metallophosphoesterase [Oscillospiraceae bacterium]|nr:metallophosphoesterase [Oscillospiraceae bacterium]
MRFIHAADMHFDSPFTVLSSKNLGDIRRLEQRKVFSKMIEHIKLNKIPFLFISGDLYEQEYVKQSTIEYINDLFKTIPDTKIFISPGNHDPFLKNSEYSTFDWNENVYIFNNEIGMHEFPEADIYGFGFTDFYCTGFNIEDIQIKDREKTNILVVHGDLDASITVDMRIQSSKSSKIKRKRIFICCTSDTFTNQYMREKTI